MASSPLSRIGAPRPIRQRIDVDAVRRLALRAGPVVDSQSGTVCSLMMRLNEIASHVAVNRPLVLARALGDLARNDPLARQELLNSDLVQQLRAEVALRKEEETTGAPGSDQEEIRRGPNDEPTGGVHAAHDSHSHD